MDFSNDIYHGYLVKGDLLGAIRYVKQFPEQTGLYDRFMSVFVREQYIAYEVDADLNDILAIYQKYYRDAFYLCVGRENAADRLRARLAGFFGVSDNAADLDGIERSRAGEAFQSRGFYFMGGRTSGYYGPYIWRTTETKTYEVELPDGVQAYTIKLMDGFISRSWMDYLSFGKIGTGGWTDQDGVINCVRSSYDLDSENFKVSLLKHEAQHARDLKLDPNMPSEDLEYRAKLVELIYSSERNMLGRFIQESDGADKSNGHSSASSRILKGFVRKLNLSHAEIERLPNKQVQDTARALYEESKNTGAVK